MNTLPLLSSAMTDNQASTVTLLIILNIVLLSVIFIFLFIRFVLPLFKKGRGIPARHNSEKSVQNPRPDSLSDDKAAIAMALYLYFNEIHDEESDIITVKRVSRTYSPWSSKLYNMRNLR